MTEKSKPTEKKEAAKRTPHSKKKDTEVKEKTHQRKPPAAKSSASKETSVKPVSVKTERPKKTSKKPETRIMFTGRRKESVSRTKLVKGTGEVTINGKKLTEYFKRSVDQYKVKQPLVLLGLEKDFDIHANVYGGGTTGQSEAIRLSISRSLQKINPEYHKKLKEYSLLTRDSRMVERKKYGLHKARRASQFSKR